MSEAEGEKVNERQLVLTLRRGRPATLSLLVIGGLTILRRRKSRA